MFFSRLFRPRSGRHFHFLHTLFSKDFFVLQFLHDLYAVIYCFTRLILTDPFVSRSV
jgi:hypothetical protein